MPQLVNKQTGDVVNVADPAEALSLLQGGSMGLRSDRPVDLVTPDGQLVNADAQNVGQLLQGGFRFASERESIDAYQAAKDAEEYGDVGSQVAAGLEGAGRGLTFGASDWLLAHSGLTDKEDIAKRQEYNPITAGIGEAAGIVGGALLTGGSSLEAALPATLAARAGQAVEGLAAGTRLVRGAESAGLLGRTLASGLKTAASGATEGALYGAAKAVDDDYLRDHEITAERVALGAGLGALTGGAFGGGAGILGNLGKEGVAAIRAKGPALREFADATMDNAAFSHLSGGNRAVSGADAQGGTEALGRFALDNGIVTKSSTLAESAAVSRAVRDEASQRASQIVGQLDDTGIRPDTVAMAQAMRSKVIAPLKADAVTRELGERVEGKLQNILRELEESGTSGPRAPGQGPRQFNTWENVYDAQRKWEAILSQPGLAPAERKALQDAHRAWEDGFTELAESAVQSAPGMDGAAWKAAYQGARDRARKAGFISELVEDALKTRAATQTPSELGMSAALSIAHGNPGILAMSFLSSQANRIARERGAAFIAGGLHGLKKARAAQLALKGEQAIEGAADGLLASIKRGGGKARDAMKARTPLLGTELVLRDPQSYEAAITHVENLQNPESPQRQQFRANLAPVTLEHPEMAQALESQVQRTADFLAEKAGPRSVQVDKGPFSRLDKPKHDKGKAAKFARYASAAQDPLGALQRLESGKVLTEDVETLKALYPRLYQRFASRALQQIAEMEEKPSYEARRALSRALGVPVDPMTRPESVAWMQTQIAQAGSGQSGQQGGPGGPTPPPPNYPTKAPDVEDHYASRTDQMLQRGE